MSVYIYIFFYINDNSNIGSMYIRKYLQCKGLSVYITQEELADLKDLHHVTITQSQFNKHCKNITS